MLSNLFPFNTFIFTTLLESRKDQEDSIVDVANQWLFDEYGPNGNGQPPDIVRKYYYRAYVLIKHGTLGAQKKIIIPECVRKGVRNLYPYPE